MIPISVLITTYNEEQNLARCLNALQGFDDIIVIDSNSTDRTVEIAQAHQARVENFTWYKAYPKKRQWCLNHLDIKHDFIFFVDGDEVVTDDLIDEIRALDFTAAGYFVRGQYVWKDKVLHHGLQNNKLVLFHKNKVEFPVIDDLDIDGMGEMEGHYQPVLKEAGVVEQLQQPLLHYAYDGWEVRHDRYAQWEAQMIQRDAYPKDPNKKREFLKSIFRKLPLRGVVAFLHSYIYRRGFLDGAAGFDFAMSRLRYYNLVAKFLRRQ